MIDPDQNLDMYGIHAFSAPWTDRTRVLKSGDAFAVFQTSGDVIPLPGGQGGLYLDAIRHLSGFVFKINGVPPLVLSSATREDNLLLHVDMTTPDTDGDEQLAMLQDRLHVAREQFLWDQCCYVRLRFTNYHSKPIRFEAMLEFQSDFRDIFEVRGMSRPRRGELLETKVEPGLLRTGYLGLDDVERTTEISIAPVPDETTDSAFITAIELEPGAIRDIEVQIRSNRRADGSELRFDSALATAEKAQKSAGRRWARVETSNVQFNEWLIRSNADMGILATDTGHGLYPYAGIPWFSTAFGRDGIIAALETLWVNPDLAAGVLRYLAANQATDEDAYNEAQPGKILHETRGGEMAALDEHPFRKYYGSVDATPLFVVLAGAYYRATGNQALIRSIWPNIVAAIGWIDEYGDSNGDGFVDYSRTRPDGLINQGWKDSQDSVFHRNGADATPPIALAEIQGYVYGARMAAATLGEILGHAEMAERNRERAAQLQEAFDEAFWDAELESYVLAVDGNGQPCRVVTSNPGHCLLTGLIPPARAKQLARRLAADDMFSGWGIRTLAAGQTRYNPMSYHNGSIWPHDNALIAAGLARYGLSEYVEQILTGSFDAATHFDMQRIPELFCGFDRRAHQGPTLYPVACLPQAWSAAAVFMLLGASLGLDILGAENLVRIVRPSLPEYLDTVRIEQLRVGEGTIDLEFHRYEKDIGVNVLRRDGEIDVAIIK